MIEGLAPSARSDTLRILSIDHGLSDLCAIAPSAGTDPARLPRFKQLVAEAAVAVATGRAGYGMFLDDDLGACAIDLADREGLWLARQFPHGTSAYPMSILSRLPLSHVVKVMVSARSGVSTPVERRLDEVRGISMACSETGRALLVEVLPGEGQTTRALIEQVLAHGIQPAWWLVEAQSSAGTWADVACAAGMDAKCRGLIMIARTRDAASEFEMVAQEPMVCGFVGGRSLFGATLVPWLTGQVSDLDATRVVTARFREMCSAWDLAVEGGSR